MTEKKKAELIEEKDVETRTVWYEDLANEIILRAVYDYRKCLEALKKLTLEGVEDKKLIRKIKIKIKEAEKMRKDCEKFFLSGWYGLLTEIPGEKVMSTIKEQVGVN